MPTLDGAKQLISDLWLDQPDAHREIDERLAAGRFSETEADQLRHFTDHGYVTLSLGLDEAFSDAFEDDLARLWAERPVDLAAAPAIGGRISLRDFEEHRKNVGYRIADPHSHSERALALYLNPDMFRIVELIFYEPAIAFQSLYFQFGSQQSLHRDPMFVVTKPPSHLLASWTALEDITAASGPLLYAPGSHRMPWYEFDDDKISAGKKDRVGDGRAGFKAHWERLVDELGLEVKEFTCNRGDVLLWHGGLLHGGAEVRDSRGTRHSYVVHYSTAAHYGSRKASMKMKVGEGDDEVWRGVSRTTDRRLERDGCTGLDNPLRGVAPPD